MLKNSRRLLDCEIRPFSNEIDTDRRGLNCPPNLNQSKTRTARLVYFRLNKVHTEITRPEITKYQPKEIFLIMY